MSLNTGNAILSNAITVDGSYNVGIGTTPSYKLDVNGTGRFSGNLYTSDIYLGNGSALRSSIGEGIVSYSANVNYFGSGNVNHSVSIYAGGNQRLSIATTGAATFSSSVTANAAAYPQLILNNPTAGAGIELHFKDNGTLKSKIGTLDDINSWQVYNGGAIRFTINNSGNVGIGTSSPAAQLEIKSGTSGFRFFTSTSTSAQMNLLADLGGGYDNAGSILAAQESTNNSYLAFGTKTSGSLTEKMRITSGGFVKQSNTGTYQYLSNNIYETISNTYGDYVNLVSNSSANPFGTWIRYSGASPNSSNNEFFICSDNVNTKLIIYSSGTIVNRTGSYGTISDIKYKENIIDATPKLADLLQLKVRNFNMIGDEIKQIGFIAQEFEEVFPSMVEISIDKESGDEYKSIKTSVLVPMLVKAIQELNQTIQNQQQQINQLINK